MISSYAVEYASPFGKITLASDGESLTGAWFEGQKYFGVGLSPKAARKSVKVIDLAKAWLDQYFAGQAPSVKIPLDPLGTPFQTTTWLKLTEIPYGQLTTYGAIARSLSPSLGIGWGAGRSIGATVGRNPIAIIIPCHRVIKADGTLSGYAAGPHIKRELLKLEGVDPPETD